MKVNIVLEHLDGIGCTAKYRTGIVHGDFFGQRRVTDFVEGMISYVNSYESPKLLLVDGKVLDENGAILF